MKRKKKNRCSLCGSFLYNLGKDDQGVERMGCTNPKCGVILIKKGIK